MTRIHRTGPRPSVHPLAGWTLKQAHDDLELVLDRPITDE
jgi:hypothetical protein